MRTAKYYHHFFKRIIIRPAMAPMTMNGSFPDATGVWNGASGGLWERSSSQPEKRKKVADSPRSMG